MYHRLTVKQRLSLAQFFLSTYEEAERQSDLIDPRGYDLPTAVDNIAAQASHAFVVLVGRHPSLVSMTDLNTEHPNSEILAIIEHRSHPNPQPAK
jgi:hypothetical protein